MKSDDILKQLGGIAGERGIAPDGHLDHQTLQAIRSSSLSEEARSRAEAHLAGCDRCLDLIITFEAEEPVLSPGQFRRVMAATEPAPSRQPLWAWFGVPVMAAAAALLMFWPLGQSGVGPYNSTLTGEAALVRGEKATGGTFTPDTHLVFQVMPQGAAPQSPPEVALFLHAPDGQWHRAEVRLEMDPVSGLITVRAATSENLGQAFGSWEGTLILSPAGQPLPPGEVPAPDLDNSHRVLKHSFTYAPSAEE